MAEQQLTKDIKKIFDTEYWNGLHGFGIIGGDYLQLAKLDDSMDDEKKIDELRRLSGSETVTVVDWLSRKFLKIKWYEHDKIQSVFEALSGMGESCRLSNKLDLWIPPNCDEPFTLQSIEKRAIAQFHTNFSNWMNNASNPEMAKESGLRMYTNNNMLRDWNWHTQVGKDFCAYLKNDMGMVDQYIDDSSRYTWRGYDQDCRENRLAHRSAWGATGDAIPVNFGPDRLGSNNIAPPGGPVVSESVEQPDLCMLCEDNVVNTMVLPCMHKVVCQECSAKLADTPHTRKCIACTCPITEVHQDGVPIVFK